MNTVNPDQTVLKDYSIYSSLFRVSGFATEISKIQQVANSLNLDQAQQNVCLTLMVFLKEFFGKVIFFKKISRQQQKYEKLTSMEQPRHS